MDSALAAQIQAGRKLKKATTNDRSAPAVAGKPAGSGRPGGGLATAPRPPGAAPKVLIGSASATPSNQGFSGSSDGPPQLAGLFAGGMPTLKKTTPSRPAPSDGPPVPKPLAVQPPTRAPPAPKHAPPVLASSYSPSRPPPPPPALASAPRRPPPPSIPSESVHKSFQPSKLNAFVTPAPPIRPASTGPDFVAPNRPPPPARLSNVAPQPPKRAVSSAANPVPPPPPPRPPTQSAQAAPPPLPSRPGARPVPPPPPPRANENGPSPVITRKAPPPPPRPSPVAHGSIPRPASTPPRRGPAPPPPPIIQRAPSPSPPTRVPPPAPRPVPPTIRKPSPPSEQPMRQTLLGPPPPPPPPPAGISPAARARVMSTPPNAHHSPSPSTNLAPSAPPSGVRPMSMIVPSLKHEPSIKRPPSPPTVYSSNPARNFPESSQFPSPRPFTHNLVHQYPSSKPRGCDWEMRAVLG